MSAFASHGTHIPWFGSGLCPFRLAGDLCLVLSGPWLLYRIRVKGTEGISLETQILRLLTFGARYLDVFFKPPVSSYNTTMKFIILVSGLLSVAILARGGRPRSAIQSAVRMPLFFSVILLDLYLATQHAHGSNFIEFAWAASVMFALQSEIFQFQVTASTGIMDWQIMVYLGLITAYRVFYLPHWYFRFREEGSLDTFTISAAIGTLSGHAMGFCCIAVANVRRRMRKNVPEIASEEAAQPLLDIKDPIVVEEKN